MTETPQRSPDELLESVLAGTEGEESYDLLNALFAGYPVDRLRPLLNSGNESAVRAGVWIASELASQAAVLVEDVAALLHHPATWVRVHALEVIVANASSASGPTMAQAIARIRDPEPLVRARALAVIAHSPPAALRASLSRLDDSALAEHLARVLDDEMQMHHAASMLSSDDRLDRMFGAAAAVRLTEASATILANALDNPDAEVASFARSQLEMVAVRLRGVARRGAS